MTRARILATRALPPPLTNELPSAIPRIVDKITVKMSAIAKVIMDRRNVLPRSISSPIDPTSAILTQNTGSITIINPVIKLITFI